MESEETQSIYSEVRYNNDFIWRLEWTPKTDNRGSRKNRAGKRRRAGIDAVLNKTGPRERARAIASLRRVKEIKQFLMSLFLSRSRVRNGTLASNVKVAVSLLLLRIDDRGVS